MVLGVLSDTHGQAPRAARAIALLKRVGAEAFVHCGDVGSSAVFDQLAGLRAWFVWGNTDDRGAYSPKYLRALGLTPSTSTPTVLVLDGRCIHVFHGHEPGFARLAELAESGDAATFESAAGNVDYVLYGHTHVPADTRIGRVRFVNPGALQRTRIYTVATLDLATDKLEHWRVDDNADPSDRPRRFRL